MLVTVTWCTGERPEHRVSRDGAVTCCSAMKRKGSSGFAVSVGLACLVLVAGCGSDDKPTSGISIDTLSGTTGTACAVPLDAAATNSGVEGTSPAQGSVLVGDPVVVDPSTAIPQGTSPVDAADAVEVTCTMQVSTGGQIDLTLIAARTDAAAEVLIPAAAKAAGLSTNQAQQLANDATRAKASELVPVPGSNAVAMMVSKVRGAASTAFVVSSPTLKRAQVEQIARQLDQRLR